MLVKVKVGDQTLEFDSRKHLIAVLLDPQNKEAVDKMGPDEPLILTGPVEELRDAGRAWDWALNNWKGAKVFSGAQLIGGNGLSRG